MKPEIVSIREKKLVGIKINTSLKERNSMQLWKRFIAEKPSIENMTSNWNYSVQYYHANLNFDDFNSDTMFDSCAAVEVHTYSNIPIGLEPITIHGGMYAIFIHKGTSDTFHKTAEYIFKKWLKNSIYELDDRCHFEILKEEYLDPNNPNSKEEVWIPVKNRIND